MRLSAAGTLIPVDILSAAAQLGCAIAVRSQLEKLLPGTEWGHILFGRTSPTLVGTLWPDGPEARVLSPIWPEVHWMGWTLGHMVTAGSAHELVQRLHGAATEELERFVAQTQRNPVR